jgi:hypothetical protein
MPFARKSASARSENPGGASLTLTPEESDARWKQRLSQARLDRIVNPLEDWLKASFEWQQKFRNRKEWPTASIRERVEDLEESIPELQQLLENPPREWTPETWKARHSRLNRWKAQKKAALSELELRRIYGGSTYVPSRTPTGNVELPEGLDPFRFS